MFVINYWQLRRNNMSRVLEDFEVRAEEVTEYIRFLKKVERSTRRVQVRHGCLMRSEAISDESFRIMKASAFLLIYNLVESSIRSAFCDLYESIRRDGVAYRTASNAVRGIWIQQRYNKLINQEGTSLGRYREVAIEIATSIVDEAILELDHGKLPGVSGTLDSDKIRKVCTRHGIRDRTHPRAEGGNQLALVKAKRNNLAHGNISFSECGREYASEDLRRIANQATIFVRSMLKNIVEYTREKRYTFAA